MSSIFSDPPFRRGTTLLDRELIELENGVPVAGAPTVGEVKVFQDSNPVTGQIFSNRLVYCVAARWKGSDVNDASTVAGTVYAFDPAAPLTDFSAAATTANITAGRGYGVLDEYITGPMRTNDIVWLVIKGPTTVNKTSAAITAGAAVEMSATDGSVQAANTGVQLGLQIAGANAASGTTKVRVNLWSDRI